MNGAITVMVVAQWQGTGGRALVFSCPGFNDQ